METALEVLHRLKEEAVKRRIPEAYKCVPPFFRAYGGSQARGPIRAAAAGLHHSHSHARPEPHLRPTPQLTAGMEPAPSRFLVGFVHAGNSCLAWFLDVAQQRPVLASARWLGVVLEVRLCG